MSFKWLVETHRTRIFQLCNCIVYKCLNWTKSNIVWSWFGRVWTTVNLKKNFIQFKLNFRRQFLIELSVSIKYEGAFFGFCSIVYCCNLSSEYWFVWNVKWPIFNHLNCIHCYFSAWPQTLHHPFKGRKYSITFEMHHQI